MLRRDEVGVSLACGARAVVRVRVERAECSDDDCPHPTAREAADDIRLAVLEASLQDVPPPTSC